ncbi:MAG TPA: hypothetical protein VGJ20_41060 [Xanthobacteraceae bacterium]
MTRNVTATFAAAAAFAIAGLASTSSYARSVAVPVFRGHGSGTIGTVRAPGHPIGRVFIPPHGTHHPIIPRPIVKLCVLGRPCPPPPPVPPIWVGHHHHHHWVFRGGRWIIDDAVEEAPIVAVPAVTPGPCGCLTKTYTPTGLVVFADVCTRESASAPATDDHADASQAPTTPVPATATPMSEVPTAPNYAGKTYEDYLAANPQLAQPEAFSATPQQE